MKGPDWLIVLGVSTIVTAGGFSWLAAMTFAFGGGWEGLWAPHLWKYAVPALVMAAAFLAVAYRLYRSSRGKIR